MAVLMIKRLACLDFGGVQPMVFRSALMQEVKPTRVSRKYDVFKNIGDRRLFTKKYRFK